MAGRRVVLLIKAQSLPATEVSHLTKLCRSLERWIISMRMRWETVPNAFEMSTAMVLLGGLRWFKPKTKIGTEAVEYLGFSPHHNWMETSETTFRIGLEGELNGGENSFHWKANMLPLFGIMTLWLPNIPCIQSYWKEICLLRLWLTFLNLNILGKVYRAGV